MNASNTLKTLFTCSVQENILGAHSSKSAVQRVNLVEKILYQMRGKLGVSKTLEK